LIRNSAHKPPCAIAVAVAVETGEITIGLDSLILNLSRHRLIPGQVYPAE
jgi:hypothetical protein